MKQFKNFRVSPVVILALLLGSFVTITNAENVAPKKNIFAERPLIHILGPSPAAITYSAALDKLPMLVKAGAIIPMIDVQQTWLESSVDRLTLRIYPESSSQFTIAGDDKVYPGRSKPYTDLKETEIKCHQVDGRIDIDISPSEISYMLEVHCGAMPSSVRLDGNELKRCTDMAALDKADSGWTFEQSAGPAVWIKVPGQAAARHAIRIMLESIE